MSMESARQFLSRVESDEGFRQGLGACKSREAQHEFARAAGFDFTVDEVRAASTEIQDDDLDRVSGGNCCGSTCESENQATILQLLR